MASFQAFERDIAVFVQDLTGPTAVRSFAEYARNDVADLIRTNRASATYRRFVNGREGVSEDNVVLPGPIIYEFSHLEAAVLACIEFLRVNAPKPKTGRYNRSIKAMVNGNPWDGKSIPGGADVLVLSGEPYSRKIAVGSKGFEQSKGLFKRAARKIDAQFRNLVDCTETYVELEGGYILKRWGTRGKAKRIRSDVKPGDAMRYPAVKIKEYGA